MTLVAIDFSDRCADCGNRTTPSRQLCSRCTATRTRSRFARQREERFRLIEEYLALGVDAERIAADFDVTPAALARQLHRFGRRDLARPFQAQWRRRKREQRARAATQTSRRAA